MRISATDWMPNGFTGDEAVTLAGWLHESGCDLLDVSTSGISPDAEPEYGRMFQVPYAERIRYAVPDLPVMTVGAVLGIDHANTIVAAGRADACALARVHLRDPYHRVDVRRSYVNHYFLRRYPFCLKKGETIEEAANVELLLAIGDEESGLDRKLDAQGLLDRGAARFHVGDYKAAREDFTAVLAKNAKEHRARLGLALTGEESTTWDAFARNRMRTGRSRRSTCRRSSTASSSS